MAGSFFGQQILSWLLTNGLDFVLVLVLTYLLLLVIGEKRTFWMVRGLILLMLAEVISQSLELRLLNFVLEKLVLGSAVAMAVIFQTEFRYFLELLGQGKLWDLIIGPPSPAKAENVIDELVEAVKELSQNRVGALILVETNLNNPLDSKAFVNAGIPINGEVSKELVLTIFQPKTPLHDGAILIRGARLIAAMVILPLSERSTSSRQLGTRHRAAMGMTERLDDCICIVVSEETGSISLAERGVLNRPLTSTKLKELLEVKLAVAAERETVTPSLSHLSRTIGLKLRTLILGIRRLFASSHNRKK
jgi:uncharacterized protein (TIGR00159 family)